MDETPIKLAERLGKTELAARLKERAKQLDEGVVFGTRFIKHYTKSDFPVRRYDIFRERAGANG